MLFKKESVLYNNTHYYKDRLILMEYGNIYVNANKKRADFMKLYNMENEENLRKIRPHKKFIYSWSIELPSRI